MVCATFNTRRAMLDAPMARAVLARLDGFADHGLTAVTAGISLTGEKRFTGALSSPRRILEHCIANGAICHCPSIEIRAGTTR